MAGQTFTDKQLLELIEEKGLSQAEAARELKVSRAAVSQRLSRMSHRPPAVTIRNHEEVIGQKINALAKLGTITERAQELLDLSMAWARGEKHALEAHEIKGIAAKECNIKLSDPALIALKAMGELRNLAKLEMEIFRDVFDIEATAEFQEAVLTTIEEISPDVREKILDRLKEISTLREAVNLY